MAQEDADDSERTEDPTAQRREDFRKQGQVAQTKELATVLVLFSSALLIWFLGRFFFAQLAEVFVKSYDDFIFKAVREGEYKEAIFFAFNKSAIITLPFLGIIFVIGIASSFFQIGFLTTTQPLEPDLQKINPINGLKKIFSLTAIVEGLKALLKLTIIALVAYALVKSEITKAPYLVNYSIPDIGQYLALISFKLIFGIAIAMSFIAIFDYGFQRWELEKKMRMTKQEVKEEVKSREGDPQIKARIRRIQRELSNKRMMQDVPKAEVIITNPTHIAIALKYDALLPAPQLVAKGAGAIAEKIKEIARENNIPIVENKPLARAIFKTMKLGQVIPRELFNAVAEVLAYVYKLKKKKNRRSTK